mmetsp:Transcript_52162/g.137026  ORF Transcript_52162/g.137026 Transcript_52162/m.137026 type:complete len:209 (-) Transcript_52162:78-704(-)
MRPRAGGAARLNLYKREITSVQEVRELALPRSHGFGILFIRHALAIVVLIPRVLPWLAVGRHLDPSSMGMPQRAFSPCSGLASSPPSLKNESCTQAVLWILLVRGQLVCQAEPIDEGGDTAVLLYFLPEKTNPPVSSADEGLGLLSRLKPRVDAVHQQARIQEPNNNGQVPAQDESPPSCLDANGGLLQLPHSHVWICVRQPCHGQRG